MTTTALRDTLQPHVDSGAVPGAVALVARADDVDAVTLGRRALDGAELTRDSLFRIASITKPITAAATLLLVEQAKLDLDAPVDDLLPELAKPQVLRDWRGPVEDTVPADRPITTRDLLSFRAGHGFPPDFGAPVVQLLFTVLGQGPPQPHGPPPPDDWMELLSRIPLLHQPGAGWTYNTGSDVLGVLIARASGRPLTEYLTEHVFAPLGMRDTAFHVPATDLSRFTTSYRPAPADAGSAGGPPGTGGLTVVDEPSGQWSTEPVFPSGAGGLVSTADDWLAFGRMLLAGGACPGGRLLSQESVRMMTTNYLDGATRDSARAFLQGQGWGFGGSVDVEAIDAWNVPGRYGWVGGSGTAAHVVPAAGLVTILLTQVELPGPAPTPIMRDFWSAALR